MKSSRTHFLLCFACILFAALASLAKADQVVNGGFETGSFSPWTFSDSSGFTNIGNDPSFAHSGTYHANLGASGVNGSLSQMLATTAGTSYNLSFWLANDGTVPPNLFSISFNGVTLMTLTDASPFAYTNFTFNNLLASSSTTTLQFTYRNDDDFFRLDDVSVNASRSAVPESGSTGALAMLALGAVGLAYRQTRNGNAGA